MKNIFMKLGCIVASVSLVASCSTNTQNQNTAAGAVTGGVVGGGVAALAGASGGVIAGAAIVGALVGGVIGHNMDSSDQHNVYVAMDKTPTNKTRYWKNRHTGAVYKVVPTSNRMTINGNTNCRTYNAYTTYHGKQEMFSGTACRQADGSWKTMRS